MLRAMNHATVGRQTPMSTRGMGEWKTILGASPWTASPDLVTTLKAPKVTRVSCRWRQRRHLTVLRPHDVEGRTLMQQLDEQMTLQGAAPWTTLPDSATKWKDALEEGCMDCTSHLYSVGAPTHLTQCLQRPCVFHNGHPATATLQLSFPTCTYAVVLAFSKLWSVPSR